MNLIIYVILCGRIAGQTNLDRLKTLALTETSGHLTVRNPVHPAVILNMCAVLDPAVNIGKGHVQRFKALRFARSTA